MAVAAGGEAEGVLPGVISNTERRTAQAEGAAQLCPCKGLPANGHLRDIPGIIQYTLAEPPGGGVFNFFGGQPQSEQHTVDLLGAVGDGGLKPRCVSVPGGGHAL